MRYRYGLLWKFCLLLSAIVVALTIWIDYSHLVEAYGGGPPYYGRTTNMDKWESPISFLILINLASIICAATFVKLGLFLKRKG